MDHKQIKFFFITTFFLISAATHCSGYANEKKCVVITFSNHVAVDIAVKFKPDACNHQNSYLILSPGKKKSIPLSAGSTISVITVVRSPAFQRPNPTVFKANQSNAQVTCEGNPLLSPRCRYDDNKM